MPKQNTPILTDEEIAIKKYKDTKAKASETIYTQMNKQIRSDNIKGGLLGGLALGIIAGALIGDSKTRVPVYDSNNQVVDYTFNPEQLSLFMLKAVALAVIATMTAAAIKTKVDIKKNRLATSEKVESIFKKYFDDSLSKFDPIGRIPPKYENIRYTRAAALVLNNMPETEVDRLHAFVTSGLVKDSDGKYVLQEKYVDTAAHIISNYISYNPELKSVISYTLLGNEPKTYFLNSLNQKTK